MPRPDYTLPLDQLPDPLPIEPLTKAFDVTITPPGSKSITCRAYVLAALAQGESKLIRPLRADDTELLLKALCTLGAEARWEGEDVYIKGVGGRFPRGGSVNLGDGGTPTRFMIACACLAAEPVVVDGSKRMRERPIAEGVEMLRQLGAKIEYVETEGRLPVRVTPSEKFVGGDLRQGRTSSSQSISAIMLIGAYLELGVRIAFTAPPTSASYLMLTCQVLNAWRIKSGINIDKPKSGVLVRPLGEDGYCPAFVVEPDASSAAYWLAAAAGAPLAHLVVRGLARWSEQPDGAIVHALERAGMQVEETSNGLRCGGSAHLRGVSKSCLLCPDGAVVLAAIAAIGTSNSRLTGLRTLRVKETDRIAALANELRKVGCEVATGEDWIEISPPKPSAVASPRAATVRERSGDPLADARGSSIVPESPEIVIETYNDHRMAMAFAVLGLAAPGGRKLAIRNPACVAKSYPTFWRDFATLYQ